MRDAAAARRGGRGARRAGLSAIPGSSTATRTRRSPATGRTSSRFGPRGATYEELLAAGGGILSTTRATRAAGAASSSRSSRATATRCSRTARRRSRGRAATASTTTPSSRSSRRSRAAGGIPTWLGAHAVPPEHPDADAYVDWAIEAGAPGRGPDRGCGGRVRRARDVRRRAGAPVPLACRAAGLVLRLHGDQLNEIGAVGLAVELGARSIDHLEATGTAGVARARRERRRRRPAPRRRALPARPMPPGARARRRGRGDRARDGLQPRERVLREPPGRLHARVHAARARAGGGARGLHRQRGARPRPPRPRPHRAGLRADLVLLDAPDWRHLAYHLAGDLVHTVVRGGRVASARA